MERPGPQQSTVLGLLLCVCTYLAFVWLPAVSQAQFTGMNGTYVDGRFIISRVFSGGPAEDAGIRAGDVVIALDGRSIASWHDTFVTNLPDYLAIANGWRQADVALDLARDGKLKNVSMSLRSLNFLEAVRFFGVRIAIVGITLGLVIFLLASRPRDTSAFPIALVFCTLSLWLVTDSTFSPVFLSPLLDHESFSRFATAELLSIISVQITLSLSLHIVLVFPEKRRVLDKYPWILAPIYIVPLGVLVTALLATEGNLTERLNTVYGHRLWLDSSILVVFLVLIIDSYQRFQSPTQREQTKWVMIAGAVVAVTMVGLWNLPRMLLGHPLVPDYDWVLVPIVLIPLAFTFAIANHELLGVRGIIGRRIRSLESELAREKSNAGRKEDRIRDLAHEIDRLRIELTEYIAREESPAGAAHDAAHSVGIERLERRHPALARIRKTRLLGCSPRWEPVFEDLIVAARGIAPVLVVGESGTGKTDAAWSIWQLGERAAQPYKAVSCAQFEHADPAFSLGRLFGIGRGHGLANVDKDGQTGLLQDCDGGTLFLDDFDRLPLNIQDLFLYPFEGKPFEPGIGTGPSRDLSIKFILAINRDPDELIATGILRGDVLARVGARVEIPPLRERSEDIPMLVDHFVATTSTDLQYVIEGVSPKAMSILSHDTYSRGNVRELKSEIAQAIGRAMLDDEHELRAGHLSEALRAGSDERELARDGVEPSERTTRRAAPIRAPTRELGPPWESFELDALRRHAFNLQAAETELGLSHKSRTLSNHLRGMCMLALMENNWDVQRAAAALSASSSQRVVSKLEAKMRRFLEHVSEKTAGREERKLFNNLPAAYHDALDAAIAQSRDQRD